MNFYINLKKWYANMNRRNIWKIEEIEYEFKCYLLDEF